MCDPITIILAASLTVSAFEGHQANQQNKEAYKDQKKANQIRTASEINADNARKQQAAREARIKRGQMLAQSQATGGAGSSSETSAVDLLTTNFNIQTAFTDSQADAAQAVSDASTSAAKHNMKAQNDQQIMQLSNSIFGATLPSTSWLKG